VCVWGGGMVEGDWWGWGVWGWLLTAQSPTSICKLKLTWNEAFRTEQSSTVLPKTDTIENYVWGIYTDMIKAQCNFVHTLKHEMVMIFLSKGCTNRIGCNKYHKKELLELCDLFLPDCFTKLCFDVFLPLKNIKKNEWYTRAPTNKIEKLAKKVKLKIEK
jgi:hypothetical protein